MKRRTLLRCAAFALAGPWLALAVDTDEEGPAADPDVLAGKRAIDDKRWSDAVRLLSSAALRDTRNADIESRLGYAYRNLGRMQEAFAHYERALKLNPRHRGAHEYAGEAALIVGDLPAAEQHLAARKAICLLPCEELGDLQKAIGDYKKRVAR
jgi:Flp pilus assembly protein TadD